MYVCSAEVLIVGTGMVLRGLTTALDCLLSLSEVPGRTRSFPLGFLALRLRSIKVTFKK